MPTPAGRGANAPGATRPQRVPGLTAADLTALLTGGGELVHGDARAREDIAFSGVTLDSRAVHPGDLYAALPGSRAHGADFAAAAAAAGAVAVLTDADGEHRARSSRLPALVVTDPRAVLGRLAAAVYGEPATDLTLLGVTGTNGKTTTCYLLESALRHVGRATGLVGTVETRVLDERLPSVRTTPESPDVHALLAVMRERGVQVCAMEVSSHALALHRVDGVCFDVAGFTNLSQDHLDFHADLEDYFAAKASLFTAQRCRHAVVVVDDVWGRRLAAAADAGVPVTTVCTTGDDADWVARDIEVAAGGATTAFTLTGPGDEPVRLLSPLPGDFNVANTALAYVVLRQVGVPAEAAARALAHASGVPGRMERVSSTAADSPLAVVDYAHTSDAVAAALRSLRSATRGRLVVVLGAGGDRDTGKREPMGAAAARHADVVVVTDDNPRSEDPAAVRAAVLAGARRVAGASVRDASVRDASARDASTDGDRRAVDVLEVPDRAAAVLAAVRATSGRADTVLVAGKGHERGQEVAGTVHPFDDREVLRGALEQVADERAVPERGQS